jgi:hypothetical protein
VAAIHALHIGRMGTLQVYVQGSCTAPWHCVLIGTQQHCSGMISCHAGSTGGKNTCHATLAPHYAVPHSKLWIHGLHAAVAVVAYVWIAHARARVSM